MMDLRGGCRCGAVRFRLDGTPFDAAWCHCRTCQLTSGAPAMAFASIARREWVVTSGDDLIRRSRSSDVAQRLSCTACDTPLGMQYDRRSKSFDFSIATLDDPGLVSPGFHIFWASRVPWFDPHDGLPRFDRFGPGKAD